MAGLLRHYRIDRIERWESVLRLLLAMRPDCEKHPLEIIVREEDKQKTHDQRKLFHALCDDLARSGAEALKGHSPGDIKQMIKAAYFGTDEVKVGKYTFTIIRSSEELDRDGYSHLIDFAYSWAALEAGVEMPDRRLK